MAVEIRPLMFLRVYSAAFGILWCGLLGAGFVAELVAGSGPPTIFILLMLVVGGTISYRWARIAVIGRGDELLVRNLYSTRKVPRERVEGFRVGHAPLVPFGKSIYVLTSDGGVISLDVITFSPNLLPSGRRRLEQSLGALNLWLSGR
jgi:hypothetical protein